MAAHPKSDLVKGIETPSPFRGRESAGEAVGKARSDDLVFALVGQIGAGLKDVRSQLIDQLRAGGYAPTTIKLIDHIGKLAEEMGFPGANKLKTGRDVERKMAKQAAGTWLRRNIDADITSALAVRAIRAARESEGPQGKPIAIVVDSIKHPREVELLRRVYANSFYLISVVCRPETRRRNLEKAFRETGTSSDELDDLLSRDEASEDEYGQQVRKTLHLGDLFVDTDHGNENEADDLAQDLARFIDAVLEQEVVRPSVDERGMHAAWVAGLRSACLSRQVGAAILDDQGHVLATGANDVPRAQGGLYDEGKDDHRCFVDLKFCRNDRTKATIYKEIFDRLQSAGLLTEGVDAVAVRRSIEATSVRDLVEFSRAVHAEMDALLTLARGATGSSAGATLFCTTYPCHSCARHIVAAGIREVVYIEPYTKSRATELHGDSIVQTTRLGALRLEATDHRVRFRLFSGVAPRRFAALFEKRGDLKDKNGDLVQLRNRARHRDPVLDKSFRELERVIAEIAENANTASQPKGGDV